MSTYYKYGPTPDNPTPHWYEFTYDDETGAEINGNIITLYFVDGLRGDDDIMPNGTIVEPGGPGITKKPDLVVEKSVTFEDGMSSDSDSSRTGLISNSWSIVSISSTWES